MESTLFIIATTSLILGVCAGIIMYRADFCITAMFRDLFLIKDASKLRYLLILVVVSMSMFEFGRIIGLINIYPFPLLGAPSFANIVGGILFGFGMVLAGGCVVGTLYKMGGGSVLSAVAFMGLLFGSTVYAEFHQSWSEFAKASQISSATTLPQLLNIYPSILILPLILIGGFIMYQWWRKDKLNKPAYAEGYLQPFKAAILLSILGFISYVIIGMPFGITTSYAKLGSTIENLFIPEHVASLIYFSAQPLEYIPPFSNVVIKGGAGPALDAIAAIQYPLVAGIMLGAFIYAKKVGEFKLYYKMPLVQYMSAAIGGTIVGMAARMSSGCNIWHLWGGVPILANQSLLFLLGLFPGAFFGSLIFKTFIVKVK